MIIILTNYKTTLFNQNIANIPERSRSVRLGRVDNDFKSLFSTFHLKSTLVGSPSLEMSNTWRLSSCVTTPMIMSRSTSQLYKVSLVTVLWRKVKKQGSFGWSRRAQVNIYMYIYIKKFLVATQSFTRDAMFRWYIYIYRWCIIILKVCAYQAKSQKNVRVPNGNRTCYSEVIWQNLMLQWIIIIINTVISFLSLSITF